MNEEAPGGRTDPCGSELKRSFNGELAGPAGSRDSVSEQEGRVGSGQDQLPVGLPRWGLHAYPPGVRVRAPSGETEARPRQEEHSL